MQVSSHHALTVGRNEVAEFRNRELRAMLCDQTAGAKPASAIAAVARDLDDQEAIGDLAEGDVAGRPNVDTMETFRRGVSSDVAV